MSRTAIASRYPQAVFLGCAVLINAICSVLARAITDPVRRPIVASGAAFDMVVTVTVLYYWLVVRRGMRGKASMVFVAALGLLRASMAFPDLIPGRAWIAAGAELGAVAAVAAAIRRARRSEGEWDSDPLEIVARVTRSVVPSRALAEAMAVEIAIMYYALCSWKSRPAAPAGAHVFMLGRKLGACDLLYGAAFASFFEMFPVHLVVAHWSGRAAWIVTGLSCYGAVWAVGLARSIQLRNSWVGPDALRLRFGLLVEVDVARANILAVRRATGCADLTIPRRSEPDIVLEFAEAVQVRSIWGRRRIVRSIALSTGDAAGLEARLRRV